MLVARICEKMCKKPILINKLHFISMCSPNLNEIDQNGAESHGKF